MAQVGRLAKESMMQELSAQLKARPNFFVAGVGRLSATDADTLRKQLHGMQARMLMIKRTLWLQGLTALKINGGISRLIEGSIALVFPGEALIPAAKLLADFAKQEQQRLSIRGGLVDGQVLDARQFEEFANLPSRPHLIARLIGVIESPLADVVFTVERVLGDVAWILEEASKTVKPVEPVTPVEPAQSSTPETRSTGPTGTTVPTPSQTEQKEEPHG